jgi:hypothetical protein
VKQRAATVSLAHRAARFPDPCKTETVRLTVRTLGTQHKQAAGLEQSAADRITAAPGRHVRTSPLPTSR